MRTLLGDRYLPTHPLTLVRQWRNHIRTPPRGIPPQQDYPCHPGCQLQRCDRSHFFRGVPLSGWRVRFLPLVHQAWFSPCYFVLGVLSRDLCLAVAFVGVCIGGLLWTFVLGWGFSRNGAGEVENIVCKVGLSGKRRGARV